MGVRDGGGMGERWERYEWIGGRGLVNIHARLGLLAASTCISLDLSSFIVVRSS